MLELFNEEQVYEVLLVTRSNATPVGVVRKGKTLNFKLFGGRSSEELKAHPYASIQITNDVELLVKLGLNIPVEVEFVEKKPHRWIKGLPGFYGKVELREDTHEDELGKISVLKCSLRPNGVIESPLPPRPISRADYLLLEMAVDLTRLFVATRGLKVEAARRLYERIWLNYHMYKHLGGNSEIAEKMIGWAISSLRWNP
ncbi:DUF447 family protein [Thermococcus sp. GR7]|uniref:DUF447 domain-containing protein n=1 Tax=unclassified Thermococcus TaxID=2627626 RepID=UPI00142FDCE9|nr:MULTISPECIES: DUF447 domain-containing protein [unclassified Thermococcus]NJE47732.1 DUF447 family protein [Thermococcus sp. GR7]NJE78704.1 DUF447 family protein [Thermococcus sp. GR4]NJF22412.1 DUF447 family protein [Thermococcus sp. GR5]